MIVFSLLGFYGSGDIFPVARVLPPITPTVLEAPAAVFSPLELFGLTDLSSLEDSLNVTVHNNNQSLVGLLELAKIGAQRARIAQETPPPAQNR
jgi:hypothetical protein